MKIKTMKKLIENLKDIKNCYKFYKLTRIMNRLRSDEGCVWDRKQTHESLIKYLREESAEVIENIENKKFGAELEEELGDLLLQVIFHAEIAREDGRFDVFGVIDRLNQKLMYRHPHVFGEMKADTTEEVTRIWKDMKEKEKNKIP